MEHQRETLLELGVGFAYVESLCHLEVGGEDIYLGTPSEGLYFSTCNGLTMFLEYIQAAMDRATYEIIDNPEPFYGEVPELQGVWAVGNTLEDCRRELQSVIEGWIALKLRFGHPIPPLGGCTINVSAEPVTIVE